MNPARAIQSSVIPSQKLSLHTTQKEMHISVNPVFTVSAPQQPIVQQPPTQQHPQQHPPPPPPCSQCHQYQPPCPPPPPYFPTQFPPYIGPSLYPYAYNNYNQFLQQSWYGPSCPIPQFYPKYLNIYQCGGQYLHIPPPSCCPIDTCADFICYSTLC